MFFTDFGQDEDILMIFSVDLFAEFLSGNISSTR